MGKIFTGKYYYRNDEITLVDSKLCPLKAKIAVYEVIRIINSRPLFLGDHIERLKSSLHSLGLDSSPLSVNDFKSKMASLCLENDKDIGNIEILVNTDDAKVINLFVGFIPHKYPERKDYQQGVKVGIIGAERQNPGTKVKNTDARQAANFFLKGSDCFEVLLKNRKNLITEGSRSNFFYFKDDTLFSTPVEAVLPGITRKHVLIAAEKGGMKIRENFLVSDGVKDLDAAFLSGTSLGVLPISHIGRQKLNPQYVQLQKLMKSYRELVETYLFERKTDKKL